MMRNKQQLPPPKGPPLKPRIGPRHWSQQIIESVVSSSHEDSLDVVLNGGADNGLFCFVGDVNHENISYHGQKLYTDDTILEIQGQKISGYTLRDAGLWLKQVSVNGAPVMIKTLRPGLLPKDLRQFLTARFQKASVDHDLQQTIRDNLYMRTVPCTTRPPRPGESNGVDYTFLSLEEFYDLEQTGDLLESGIFDGNHYGTPRPPKEPTNPLIRHPSSGGPGGSTSDSKRKRNNSSSEAVQSNDINDDLPPLPMLRKKSLERAHSSSNLGPLPTNWEMAFTDEGQPYFIDHDTETTHWLDPRIAKVKKDTVDSGSVDEELPYGWEKVEDPHFGTYFIDHVHRKTQYENPVITAKNNSQDSPGGEVNGNSTLPRQNKGSEGTKRSISDGDMNKKIKPGLEGRKPQFTKNVNDLKGELLQASLVKSLRGFGFTIIGAEQEDEEFLQIKNIVPNGPAYLDDKLKTGDVLVYINNTCVLGYTHQNVVSVFQSIPPGETVILDICRGYALPSNLDDPNTQIVTTVAVSAPAFRQHNQPPPYSMNGFDALNTSQRSLKPDLAKSHNVNTDASFSQHSIHGDLINSDEPPDLIISKAEMFTVDIVRGKAGFGFTIADSPYGQRVKQILDRPRCKSLQEGDILHQINDINVREMTHSQIVAVLKECAIGSDTNIIIQRGGIPLPIKGRRPVKPSRSFDDKPRGDGLIQPGAYFFNEANNPNPTERSDESFASSNPPLSQGGENDKLVELSTVQETADEADGNVRSRTPNDFGRPKTPTLNDMNRPKTPTMIENRPKTPTRLHGTLGDNRIKPPVAQRPVFSDMQNRFNGDNISDFNSHDPNHSRSEFQNSGNYDSNSRPPPGPRGDQFRHNDYGSHPNANRSDYRNDLYGHARSNYAMQINGDRRDAENIKPGQFRSRTPGPDMLNRGHDPDYRPEPTRPKTPTANDMRSKTPNSSLHNHSGFKPSGRFTPNPAWEYGQQYRHDFNRPNWPGDSPNVGRRHNHDYPDSHNRSYGNDFSRSFQTVGNNSPAPGRGPKHSTSFEAEDPMPSNMKNVPKRPPGNQFYPSGGSPRGPLSRNPDQEDMQQCLEMTVYLPRHESGFGFRIIGGTEEGSQVSVGHIVPGGAADQEGKLRQGDEIVFVDQNCVINSSHHRVVQLMGHASLNGHVTITVRRRMLPGPDVTTHTPGGQTYPYDVTVTRRENEGFGFVIISSVTKSGSTIGEFIGRILENSPAERCHRLHIGDRILAVNGVNISQIHHEDIVNLIKESGYSVTLTIGPPPDDASSTASASQRSSQGSMVNAMAYPSVSESDVNRRPETSLNNHHTWDNRYVSNQEAIRARFNNTPQGMKNSGIYLVELDRGTRGFGFSIRGGREFNNMPLFVLRIADGGAADVDGRLKVGDQILEINQIETGNMTHSEAIDIIQNGGTIVRLKMKRTNKPPPAFDGAPSPTSRYPPGAITNGPIGHSSPHLGRRQLEEYPTYPSGRSFVNY